MWIKNISYVPQNVYLNSDKIKNPEVDGEYYDGEGTIKIEVKLNPNQPIDEILDLVVAELHELVTHEVVHVLQEESGLEFPKKIPKFPGFTKSIFLSLVKIFKCLFSMKNNKYLYLDL